MSTGYFEQQPIARTVGSRTLPRAGVVPSAEARAAMDSFADRLTRAPKGVFIYGCCEDMERDRERWQTAAMVEAVRARG